MLKRKKEGSLTYTNTKCTAAKRSDAIDRKLTGGCCECGCTEAIPRLSDVCVLGATYGVFRRLERVRRKESCFYCFEESESVFFCGRFGWNNSTHCVIMREMTGSDRGIVFAY